MAHRGLRCYNNNKGVATNGKVLYTGNDVSVFGKANGMGDLELITAPTPIEIANRVRFEADSDLRDSDAASNNNDADISITAGVSGENNHAYDFGFVSIGGVGGEIQVS